MVAEQLEYEKLVMTKGRKRKMRVKELINADVGSRKVFVWKRERLR